MSDPSTFGEGLEQLIHDLNTRLASRLIWEGKFWALVVWVGTISVTDRPPGSTINLSGEHNYY